MDLALNLAIFALAAYVLFVAIIVALLGFLLDKILKSDKMGKMGLSILIAILASVLCIVAGIVAYRAVVFILEYKADSAEWRNMVAAQRYVFPIFVLAAFVIIVALIVAWLGYLLDGGLGTIILTAATTLASLLCIGVGFWAGIAHGWRWGWATALGTVLLVGWVVPLIGGKVFFSPKGAKLTRYFWFWYVALGTLVFINATWLGLATIALPAFILLIGGLFFFSRFLLPITPDQRRLAFRSLLSFALGTNFPFYVIRDWKKEGPKERVGGNTYGKFFSGPGVVLTSCDHLVITTTQVFDHIVRPPGLGFTGKYERLQDVVDLRPQLRAFTVKAETQDGIPVDVFSFWPCQIDTGGESPKLGSSFPYNEDSVFQAVYLQSQDHDWRRDDAGQRLEDVDKIDWDDFHAKVIAPPILKKVILEYTCDELCSPGDPRVDIRARIRGELEDALEPYGIQIVGGGISDLVPTDEAIQQRIENWKVRWKREITAELAELEAAKSRYEPEVIRAQVMLEQISIIARSLEDVLADDNLSQQVIALRFIESIQEMLKQSPDLEAVSPEAWEMLALQQRRLGR